MLDLPMKFGRWLIALFCSLAMGVPMLRAEFPPKDLIVPSMVADTTAIAPGKPFNVGVLIKIKQGWHTYWEYGGDLAYPPKVDWTLPEGFSAGPLQWPLPESHVDEPDFQSYVYSDEVMLMAQITPPAQLAPGEVNISAKVGALVCEKTCIPANGRAELKLPAGGTAEPANAELFATWRAKLPKAGTPFKVTWDRSKAEEFSLRLEGAPANAKIDFYPLPPEGAKPGHIKVGEAGAEGARVIAVPIVSGGAPNQAWRGVIVAERADGSREGWAVSADGGSAQSAATGTGTSAAGEQNAATKSSNPGENVQHSTPNAQRSSEPAAASPMPGKTREGVAVNVVSETGSQSLIGTLFFAFLGGLILNVMPCVLPVIALKIFGFVKQAGDAPERVFRMGLAFVAGVFTFFLGLAIAVIALKAAGRGFNWGFQFQNPYVFAGLIALVFIFGLNMLGVFEVTLSSDATSKLSELSSKEGYSGAYLHGMFTTLLGTSCTAPFLGGSLGYATTQSAPVIFAIFLVIAAGMSLPYLLLTAKPAWMRFLPKPGMWMERAKQLMGFVMLAVVVWLLGIFAVSRPHSAAGLIHYLLVLAVACWVFGTIQKRAIAGGLALLIAAAGYLIFLQDPLKAVPAANIASTSPAEGGLWAPFSEEKISGAIKAGQPVLIDFTADWCINCKVYEGAVLDTSAVKDALQKKKVVTFRADWTNGDETITRWLQKFGRVGVPLYVLYRPGEEKPVVMDALTPQGLLGELGKIGG